VQKKSPLVVICGRTNVGKSTLFNRLTEKDTALVSNIPGTTRDSNTAEVEWRGTEFTLVDTGGITDFKAQAGIHDNDIETMVQRQAMDFLKQADLVLFLVDVRDGLLPQDKHLSLLVKKNISRKKNIVLAANKADSPRLRKDTAEFNKLSLGEPLPISAATGSGTGDLLDIIIEKLEKISSIRESGASGKPRNTPSVRIAVIGKPNVGKSSLLNALIGQNMAIVSPVPHTTREPHDLAFTYQGRHITFIDTAGISKSGQRGAKRKKFKNTLDKLSIVKSLGAMKKADVILLILDINESITRQDAKLAEEVADKGAGLIIIANKWDLTADRDTKSHKKRIYGALPFVAWAPVQFVSAKTGEKIKKIFDLILLVDEQRKITVGDNALAKFLSGAVKRHLPAKAKGIKHPRIYELKQAGSEPPRFIIRIGAKDNIHFSYIKFLENRLREKYGFIGVPIRIKVIKNKRVHGAHGS
jgi:GTP-binding protein